MVLCKARSQGIIQGNQVGFEHMLKLSKNLLIFLMLSTFLQCHCSSSIRISLIVFSPPCRVNLQDHVLPKLNRINHLLLVFFSTMSIFVKMMYCQSDERGILKVPEILRCPAMMGRLSKIFLKILSVDFTFW